MIASGRALYGLARYSAARFGWANTMKAILNQGGRAAGRYAAKNPGKVIGGIGSIAGAASGAGEITKYFKGNKGGKSAIRRQQPGARRHSVGPRGPITKWGGQGFLGASYDVTNWTIKKKAMPGNKFFKMISPRQQWTTLYSAVKTSAEGLQNAWDITFSLSSHISDWFNKASRWYDDTANAYNTNVYNQQYNKSKKFFLQNLRANMRFLNAGSSTIELSLFLLKCKENASTYTTPMSDWHNGVQDLKQSYSNAQGTYWYNFPYADPRTSKTFNMNWKIVKRKNLYIKPGETEKINLNILFNRMYDTQYLNNFLQIRGHTYVLMVVQRGSLGVAEATRSLTGGTVTLTDTKLAITTKLTACNRMALPWNRNYYNAIDSGFGTADSNVWVIDPLTDAAEDTKTTDNYA